jgi:hypothetical protein
LVIQETGGLGGFFTSKRVAPFSRDDLGYYTPANTNLVVTTSSAQINLLANDLDFDAGSPVFTIVTEPEHGTILSLGNDGSFVYQPQTNFVGFDSFQYNVNDGTQNGDVADVTIAVGGKLLGNLTLPTLSQTAEGPLLALRAGIEAQQGLDTNELSAGALTLKENLLPGVELVYRSDTVVRKPGQRGHDNNPHWILRTNISLHL